MYRKIFIIFFLCLSVIGYSQNKIKSSLVWDIEKVTARIVNDSLDISISFLLLDDKVDKGAYVSLLPTLKYIDKSTALRPLVICAKDIHLDNIKGTIIRSGKGHQKITVISRIPYDVSMYDFSISVLLSETRGTKISRGERRQIAVFTRKPCPSFTPEIYFLEPPAFLSRDRKTEIPLHVSYSKNRSVLDPRLDGNEIALGEFMGKASRIVMDERVKISDIQICCYTGIAGPEAENRKIAGARLKNLISILNEGRIFGKRKASVKAVGEDWDSIYNWIDESYWSNDSTLRALILDQTHKDRNEQILKTSYPTVWNAIDNTIAPELDRFVCSINYSVSEFDDQKELVDAYRTDPHFLDPLDYFRLLSSYEPHSFGWLEVALRAASTWPESVHANVNAAAALISMQRYHEAGNYLRRCEQTPDVLYLQSVLMYMLGNIDGAINVICRSESSRIEIEETKEMLFRIKHWKESETPWNIELYSIGQPW